MRRAVLERKEGWLYCFYLELAVGLKSLDCEADGAMTY